MHSQTHLFALKLALLIVISFTHGYPQSLFQGSAYSGAIHRHRNKNWCAFIVQKNVSCAVQGSVESHVEPEAVRCPEHQRDCEPQMIYRTKFKPTYKIAYKTVTELEWRCCPGYQGPDCREVKGSPDVLNKDQPPHPQHPLQNRGQTRPSQRAERRETGYFGNRQGAEKTRLLEEEVQRLTQTVLDLQVAMTGMAENLRTDLQEDTSKMLINLLNDRTAPDSARAGGTEESVVHLDGHQALKGHTHGEREMETLLAKLSDMTDALKNKDVALEELRGTVTGHDSQIRMLMDSASHGLPVTSSSGQDIDVLQTYIDEKFDKLKKELAGNMEDEITKLKIACNDKIQSIQKTCEGKEDGYGSLTDLVHNKEAELRKEISELRLDLSMSDALVRTNRETSTGRAEKDYRDLRREIVRVSEAYRVLNARLDNELEHLSTVKMEDVLGSRLEDLEDRMNVTERNAETYCFYVEDKLSKEMRNEVAVLRQLLDQKLQAMQDQFTMLIEMSNNSFPGMSSSTFDGLQSEVNANKNLIRGLEDKLRTTGQMCSTNCKTNQPLDSQNPGLANLAKEVRLCRNGLDTLRSDFVTSIQKMSTLEDAVKTSPEKEFINAHIQDTRKTLNALTDDVGRLSGSMNGLRDTMGKFSQDLHILNSTCSPTGQVSSLSLLTETETFGHSLVEDLKDKLDALNTRVTTELSMCKITAIGVSEDVTAVDDRVKALEQICRKLDSGSNNISGELQRKVVQMNNTLVGHTGEITALQNSLLNFHSQLAGLAKQILKDHTSRDQGLPIRHERPVLPVPDVRAPTNPQRPYVPHIHIPLIIPHRPPPVPTGRPHVRQPIPPPQPPGIPRHPGQEPVVVTGQAGPPGFTRRVTIRRDQSSEDSRTPLRGFAGAPGHVPINPVLYRRPSPNVVQVPWNPAHQTPIATPVSQQNPVMEPFSFSAGLTQQSFSGEFGIIRFDQVLINDGGHYNPHTGIFTVPTEGRYLVTAVLTAPQGENVQAVLSVSNRSIQKLDTAGYRLTRDQCTCGGSASFSLIVPLRRGDTLALVRTAGTLAVSQSREMFSTFSAIYLYSPQNKR
ncbi:hypothetical protein DNTS_013315 [Danionella cerebrum]|uniref:EMI domain-containing protein n=1 Tax=Danionella cerebrum TaxID=2873325 RepID=A0A553QQW7_9TELE|nr:hypothetical protein DNTS_013315 [Danionella translucida]